MQHLTGKTAFITGGASGIGSAMAKVFAREGMNVMLADIEAGALDEAAHALRNTGTNTGTVVCDVADAHSVTRAAQAAFEKFGNVHIVCNNAGVGGGSGIDDIRLDTWRWVIDVNLMGVVYGIEAFLPHMRAHGEGGHIVNTASMAGLNTGLGFSAYVASKFAVVAMSEGLAKQVAPLGIGVTVLCPGFVRTSSLPNSARRGSSPKMSRRRFSPPFVRTNSMSSRMPGLTGARRCRNGSTGFLRRWTGRRSDVSPFSRKREKEAPTPVRSCASGAGIRRSGRKPRRRH